MGFRRHVRLLSQRCRLHRRMAGTRRRSTAASRSRIIAVVRGAERWPRRRRDCAYAGWRAMPDVARGRRAAASLKRVSIEWRRAFRYLLLPVAPWLASAAWANASRIASARLWPAQEYTRVIFESTTPIEHQLVVLRDPDR